MSIILTQTDTTVGFLSQSSQKLSEIKSRNSKKAFIKVYSSFSKLRDDFKRVPRSKRNLVRRSHRTTFIVKNRSFRVASPSLNSQVLRELHWNYSTSANAAGKNFEREFCESKADIIIEDNNGLRENSASKLIKISQYKTRRLR
jgi:tRNA A37 threonylcarbamoyladenosine synthetase subunit TsaC/SUA5/YrdC